MFHPIYSTVLGHPELVADHLANYGLLIKAEALEVKRSIIRRIISAAVAVVTALLAVVFAGIAIMLGGVNGNFHWTLVVVPGIFFVIAIVTATIAMRDSTFQGFQDLRAQVSADIHALHVAGSK
jgi:type IV secretory pathway VirB2 component (pilin)